MNDKLSDIDNKLHENSDDIKNLYKIIADNINVQNSILEQQSNILEQQNSLIQENNKILQILQKNECNKCIDNNVSLFGIYIPYRRLVEIITIFLFIMVITTFGSYDIKQLLTIFW